MTDENQTDSEKIKQLKASVAVALLKEMEATINRYSKNIAPSALEQLANAYKIVVENAPKPTQARVGRII